ncbi:MAG: GNAT family N-acetyltransferase [Crocinitomicaceae bacterium]|nr:GNAT family N-acetyltransferase [Crocinitomicaceae bacterium]
MQIKTKRALISPLSESDFDDILEMYKEPDSSTFIPPLLNKTKEYYLNFLAGKVETNKTTLGFWVARGLSTNTLIGTLNLNEFKDTGINHIGSHLSIKFWNKGYSTELLTSIIEYGFNTRNLEYIHGIMSPNHIVSKKLILKLGFSFYQEYDNEGSMIHLYRMSK